MIPRTFPSVTVDGVTCCVVSVITPTVNQQAWIDYIPVKSVDVIPAKVNRYDTDGAIGVSALADISNKQGWLDYIPVVLVDNDIVHAWTTNALGYIPVKTLQGVITAWDPSFLFTAGEQGAWYDPSDTATLFQDSAGVTPVTAVEQPVGLILDKSRGLVLGSELVTNGGPFTVTTGWVAQNATLSASGNNLVITATGVAAKARWTFTSVAGRAYRYSVTLAADATTGDNFIGVASDAGFGTQILSRNIGSALGTYTGVFFATTTTTSLHFGASSSAVAGETTSWSAVSVRELPGNHAYQTDPLKRPLWSSRVNLLTRTEEFNDAAWAVTNVTRTATTITDDGTLGGHVVTQIFSAPIPATVSATASCEFKAGTNDFAVITLSDTGNRWVSVVVNMATGAISQTAAVSSSSLLSSSISDAGSGWYRVTFSAVNPASGTFTSLRVGLVPAATGNTFSSGGVCSYTGTGTSIQVRNADLRVANESSALPPYQRVVTATDYDAGPQWPKYLRFDGDALVTNSIDFTATDEMSVFAGVRKLSDATVQVMLELSTNTFGSDGAFNVTPGYAGVGAAVGAHWGGNTRGTAFASVVSAANFPAPQTRVYTQLADISADSQTARLNGVDIAIASGDLGTGNFGNYPLYIGSRGGTVFFFNGRIFSLIVLGRTVTPTELIQSELYVYSKTYGKTFNVVYSDPILDPDGNQLLVTAGGDPLFMNVNYE
jgi:hypothetical protein